MIPPDRTFTWLSSRGGLKPPRQPELGSSSRAGLQRSLRSRSVRSSNLTWPSRARSAYFLESPRTPRSACGSPARRGLRPEACVPYRAMRFEARRPARLGPNRARQRPCCPRPAARKRGRESGAPRARGPGAAAAPGAEAVGRRRWPARRWRSCRLGPNRLGRPGPAEV